MSTCSHDWNERISAWHDGEVDRDERRRVEAHLAGCARCADAARGFGALGEALRATAAATSRRRPIAGRPRGVLCAHRRLAAVAAAALAASGAGLYAARARPLRLEGALAADLERLHLRSFSRAEPCEFQSDDPARVAGWLESALGYRVDVPSMPGATLLGARRCNVAGEPAAHLLYRVGDHALTVIVPAAGSGAAKATARFASNGPRCTEGPLGEGICVVPEAAQTAVAVSDVAPPALLSLLDPRRR